MQTIDLKNAEWYEQREAMDKLGIAERTLRTYVSVGRIKTRPNPNNRRQRVYSAQDVDRLAQFGIPLAEKAARKATKDKPAVTKRTAKPSNAEPAAPFTVPVFLEILKESMKATAREIRAERADEHEAQFLSLAESAAFLRLPKSHVHRAVIDGRLVAIKAGGWKIRRSQLMAFQG